MTRENPDDFPPDARSAAECGIRSVSDVRTALCEGHPVLGDVGALLADAIANGTGLVCGGDDPQSDHDESGSEQSAVERADQLSAHSSLVDRLRAHELVHLATTGLSLALTRRRSTDRLTELFDDEGHDAADADTGAAAEGVASAPAGIVSSAFTAAEGLPSLEGRERFLTRAEYLLEREHEAALNARLSARTGDSRGRLGLALTAYIGMPLLLKSMLTGRVRFNRWEVLSRRLKHLPLVHLQALDVFLAGLDPRYSLGQFLRHAASFLAQFDTERVLAARARTARNVWVEHLPDGLALHCMKGPAAVIEAHYAKTKATATAILKNQLKSMAVTRAGGAADAAEEAECASGDAQPVAVGTEPAAGGTEETSSAPTDLSDAEGSPDLGALSVSDERTLRQLMFDLLIAARPQTQTTLEHRTTEEGAPERFRVDVVCPDDATILRKQAAVVVTVPVTTLLGLDDRPGTVEGQPLPADMARNIAGASKFWYRMLTDPATGQVLDEVAHRYEPDTATRLSVVGTWQTCTVPGCSRPARECEIDHGVPFDHEHPERGGRTEPANLHPLCVAHHQAKTEGRIRMRRTGYGRVDWLLPLGTTATTIAPRIDAGGILTAACAPVDTEQRRAARRAIDERLVVDPVTNRRAADAVFDQAGKEFLDAEIARAEQQAARRKEQAPLLEEQRISRQRIEQTSKDLVLREERVLEREAAVCRRERTLTRDERLVSFERSEAEEKLGYGPRRLRQSTKSGDKAKRRSQSPGAPRVRYRTIVPMRVERFDLGNGQSSSLHTPVFHGAQPLGDDETGDSERTSSTVETSGPERASSTVETSGPERASAAPRDRRGRSIVDELMATAIHDELAQRKVIVDWDHVDPDLIRNPEPRPEQRPADGFDDGTPPPF